MSLPFCSSSFLLQVEQDLSLTNVSISLKTSRTSEDYLFSALVSNSSVPYPTLQARLTYTVCFLFGYLLWNLDFIYCSELTAWKRAMGMPWSFVLEFHGWWHFFTAVGAYVFMVMVDSLTQDIVDLSGGPFAWLGKQDSLNKLTKSS